ncbi:LOW QUALITY PROTEIN: dual serine/threonine and tyrosine protein kinase-like [Cydia pomonella]|uniref:LOW QUALITY PROTEIN: dual serine/threonine and tyrosine protein kinase-like n=1 Tax=Cydia pomonella TaxID=82600 RepID=UPI002ADD482A|nr:LOW QUALITY PROTEIN: dual serine/threonine and tyrosine protein kinase-like [Cydia pomonella]
MAGGVLWSRRLAARMRVLRGLVRDTRRSLRDVADALELDIRDVSSRVEEIGDASGRPAAIVVLGTSAAARARLLHCLLGRRLLPEPAPTHCRWLRIQYGSSTQVHLTLGNSEFELVEDLECNKAPWETLPLEDLIRQDSTDFSTMLEVELNIPILKDGLRIIVPPDIGADETTLPKLKQKYLELYEKRDVILKLFNPIYLYAIDRIGKNVFSDDISSDNVVCSKSEEDFWTMFNMYQSHSETEEKESVVEKVRKWKARDGDDFVLTAENCLDLHQIKEINPNAQVLFTLFADSQAGDRVDLWYDATESTEEPCCLGELPESDQELVEGIRRWYDATESTEEPCCLGELPESDQELVEGIRRHSDDSPISKALTARYSVERLERLSEERVAFMNELLDQWELMFHPPPKHQTKSQWLIVDDVEILRTVDNTATERQESDRVANTRTALINSVVAFGSDCLQDYLLENSTKLSEIHVKLVQQLILSSFELARELQVVPKKIQYVAVQEKQLFETIYQNFSEGDKKSALVEMMQEVLQELKDEVNNMDWSIDELPCHLDTRYLMTSMSNSTVLSQSVRPSGSDSTSDGEEAVSYDSCSFDDYDIINSHSSLGLSMFIKDSEQSPAERIPIANESELFSLQFSSTSLCTTGDSISVKQASLDVQRTVLSKLSRKISLKLVPFVDCLKQTYFGTLQRCLDALESTCRQELGGRPASEAMRELLSVTRQVDLQPCASFSTLRTLLEAARRLFHKLRIVGGDDDGPCCVISPVWRRQTALSCQQSLNATKLARLIATQILERLSVAHERYQAALTSLESALASRLHHTEDVKLAIRKKYAPTFARLCLESTSVCDLLMYGTPELGREIGRGQYGVVYAARGAWGRHEPAAVKSVLPADERHYRELAMEFFYTRSIPPHPRIVAVHGSIVQRRAGGALGVLLISERKERDLHAAVRAGLHYAERMTIACDIVEGIRYLHSLGLVHRDIKMKNVLLDSSNRAALSDLGFCAAEALMSGSVVGTPVHMAPELLGGDYDAAVDVYAFGILFWYLCAGNVRLPAAFEDFQNKEQLWTKVKRGENWLIKNCSSSGPYAPELLGGDYDAAVDVYAFGILFWYLCAGNVRLPAAFEDFQNKEQLWTKVKRGLRPERLPHFTDACWALMESCWNPEPARRALLGDIQLQLEGILRHAHAHPAACAPRGADSDDSLDMTLHYRPGGDHTPL